MMKSWFILLCVILAVTELAVVTGQNGNDSQSSDAVGGYRGGVDPDNPPAQDVYAGVHTDSSGVVEYDEHGNEVPFDPDAGIDAFFDDEEEDDEEQQQQEDPPVVLNPGEEADDEGGDDDDEDEDDY